MNQTATSTTTSYVRSMADQTSNLHEELLAKYKDVDPTTVENPDAYKLMAFNGYYSLNNSGAFFSVDTNMVITNGSTTPIYHVSLIVSMDGKTSNIYHFTKGSGTFDGAHLKFNEDGVVQTLPVIDLTFQHVNNADLVTATFEGTIQMPHQEQQTVQGTTYNNIIPMSMYAGLYYEDVFEIYEDPMMEIGANFSLKYKDNAVGAQLTKVDSFVYNMNMYYFTFTFNSNTVKLIMGTSAGGGKVCNNMIVPPGKDAKLVTRTLQTVKKTTNKPAGTPNSNSKMLASYAGFYLISASDTKVIEDGAFISVEGIYQIDKPGDTPTYKVELGVSLDGITCTQYTIDSTMTVGSNNVVVATGADGIEMTFERRYVSGANSPFGSLVSVSGSIDGVAFTGSTPLNPVPLKAFGGMVMTTGTSNTETLEIISDTELKYNGVQYGALLYVPLMYIVAFKSTTGSVVGLSLGTDGGKGMACIVTNQGATPEITSVFAIPNGSSGQ